MKEYKTSNIEFEVLGKPCAKSRPRFRRMGNYVQTYSTEENINYENLIKLMFINGGFIKIPPKTPIKCVIECFYQIPQSFSKGKNKKRSKRRYSAFWLNLILIMLAKISFGLH